MDKQVSSSGSQTKTRESALVITRIIDAPRARVFRAWTNEDEIKQWWGPKDFTAPTAKVDFRVGGKYLLDMRGPDGKDYWSTGTYVEIIKPERIVAMDSFSDEKGNIVPASHYGLSADYPLKSMLSVNFDEVNGRTKLTISYPGAAAGDSVNEREGWNQTLDKLADMLEMETPPC